MQQCVARTSGFSGIVMTSDPAVHSSRCAYSSLNRHAAKQALKALLQNKAARTRVCTAFDS